MNLTNELRKYIKSLQALKYRQKYNKYIAEGPKICLEIMEYAKADIEYLVCTNEMQELYPNRLAQLSGKTIICNDKELKSISSQKNPNKILIVATPKHHVVSSDELDASWALYLDKIQDPGNMGTIMRIADWFGISWVLASEDSCEFYNPKVIQSAMGAHLRVKFSVVKVDELVTLDKTGIYSLALDGEDMSEIEMPSSGILVVGNESRGVRREIMDISNAIWTIYKKGGAESLNASVACGISCYLISLATR